MKKILLTTVCLIMSFCAVAQIRTTTTDEFIIKETPKKVKSWHHSGLFFNTGFGVLAGGNYEDTGLGYELGWGYRWHIGAGISWEVFRLGANMDVLDFEDTFNFRLTTGVRYDTPRLSFMKDMSMYANFVCGAGLVPEEEEGGFVYEIGAGVKLLRRLSLGLVWQNNPSFLIYEYGYDYPANWGMFGVKVEYQFR